MSARLSRILQVREALPFILAVVVAVAVVSYWKFVPSRESEPPAVASVFAPIESHNLIILESGVFTSDTQLLVQNGFCNTSDEPVPGHVTFGFQSVPSRPSLGPIPPLLFERPITLVPMACYGRDAYRIPLEGLSPGTWQCYLTAVFMGPQAGQLQRIALLSPPFEVIASGSQ